MVAGAHLAAAGGVMRGLDPGGDEGVDLLIALYRGAGLQFLAAIAVEGALRKYFTRQAHTGAHFKPVVGVAHVVELDSRRLARIGRGQPHPAPALRAHRAHVCLEAVLRRLVRAVVADGHGQKVILDVRILKPGATADKTAGFKVIGGAEAIRSEEHTSEL